MRSCSTVSICALLLAVPAGDRLASRLVARILNRETKPAKIRIRNGMGMSRLIFIVLPCLESISFKKVSALQRPCRECQVFPRAHWKPLAVPDIETVPNSGTVSATVYLTNYRQSGYPISECFNPNRIRCWRARKSFVGHRKLENQHTISVAIEAVSFDHSVLVGTQHKFLSGKRADQYEKR